MSRTSTVTDEALRTAVEIHGSPTQAAPYLGLSPRRARERWVLIRDSQTTKTQAAPTELVFTPTVSSELPIDELIDRRITEFDRVQAGELQRKNTVVQVATDLPIGVVLFGDPHLDDPGTDLRALRYHSELVNDTPGMYAACIGDLHNNWVGRIAHLYSQQETTARDAWRLVEWWIEFVQKWLFMVDGNHDGWSGNSNPLPWIRELAEKRMVQDDHEARIALQFANGFEYRIAARHSWPGNSQWNPAHGEFKAALMRLKADLICSGHTHTSLDSTLYVEAHEIVTRCIRLGSYKRYDRYAKELGLAQKDFAPSACVIIDPRAKTLTQRSQLFYDIGRASRYLTFLRREYA